MTAPRVLGLALALGALSLAGCQDLSVENENSPARDLVLAAPEDVKGLIGGTFLDFWEATQWCGGSMMMMTMSDENSSAWANWAMRDMSSLPRVAWNNSPSYSRRLSTEHEWFINYRGITNALDGLAALREAEEAGSADDNEFTREGISVPKLRAFANFSMGLSHGFLALYFDQAFVLDENTDLDAIAAGTATLELQPYDQVMDAALGYLQTAVDIANANEFTITEAEDWIFGLEVTNAELAQIAHSYMARFRAQMARSREERAAVDWAAVIADVDAGIEETFAPIGDDDGVQEWDCMKFYGQDGTTWARADYRTIGPADNSEWEPGEDITSYEEWLDTPPTERLVFDINTIDRRITGADEPQADGKDFGYIGTNGPFPPARGTYHYSAYFFKRYLDYRENSANGPMPVIREAEMDLLKAEALLWTGGDLEMVAELINNTRVERGEMEPAEADDGAGSVNDAQDPYPDASLWAKLKHEKRIETFITSAGLAFFDDRGWGDLIEDTPIHFPVPGKDLETLGLQIYTFGGGGPGSAPSPTEPTNLRFLRKADRHSVE